VDEKRTTEPHTKGTEGPRNEKERDPNWIALLVFFLALTH
jgi:hypothetical protein